MGQIPREDIPRGFLVAASDAPPNIKAMAWRVCNGVDDQVDINAAMAALPANGGRVVLSEGTFNTSGLITANRANCWLQGQGPQATQVVIGTGLQWGIWISANHVTISDFWIYTTDGNNGSYALGSHCIGMTNSGLTDMRFRNLRLEHSRDAINWFGNQRIRVECCDFIDNHNGVGSMGYTAALSQNIWVSDCLFVNGTATAITCNPAKNVTIANVQILGDGSTTNGRIDISSNTFDAGNVTIFNVISVDAGGLLESANPLGGANPPYNIVLDSCVVMGYYNHQAVRGFFQELTLSNCQFVSEDYRAIYVQEASKLQMSNVYVDSTGYTSAVANDHTVSLESAPGAQITNLCVLDSPNANSCCLFFDGADTRITNSEFRNSSRHGVYVSGARAYFGNCRFEANDECGIWLNAADATIANSLFKDNSASGAGTADDISDGGFGGTKVLGNRFEGTNVARNYDENAVGDACLVANNEFDGTPTTAAVRLQKTGSIARNNLGWVTENSGTGTITNPATSVVVAHGLSVTPTVDDISITLAENPTNDPGNVWVDNIGAANFTVNCRNAPGTSDLDLAWRVVVL